MSINLKYSPESTYGHPLVERSPLAGSKTNKISPNWCNKTTWYSDSTRNTDITMTDSGDHTTYNLPTPGYCVDVKNGELTHENSLVSTYGYVCKVNDVEKTENSPGTTDGDYSVNYATGAVTFNEALVGTETVTSTHSKVGNSEWKVEPMSGKVLRIAEVEVQLSADLVMSDSIEFIAYAEVGKFPPFEPYRQANGGPYPDGTNLPIRSLEYKTIRDFINEANGAYPAIIAFGGTNWRALEEDMYIFRWAYQASEDIRSDWGMYLTIGLKDDNEQTGSFAYTTLYCLSDDL